MTVPYESRVRPLIAAASKAPWSVATDAYVESSSGAGLADFFEAHGNARLAATAVNTAAASADLAEAVRRYLVEYDAFKASETYSRAPMRACRVELRAALARLDAAGGAA